MLARLPAGGEADEESRRTSAFAIFFRQRLTHGESRRRGETYLLLASRGRARGSRQRDSRFSDGTAYSRLLCGPKRSRGRLISRTHARPRRGLEEGASEALHSRQKAPSTHGRPRVEAVARLAAAIRRVPDVFRSVPRRPTRALGGSAAALKGPEEYRGLFHRRIGAAPRPTAAR